MIQVVLHMKNIVLDNEPKCHDTPSDNTTVVQMRFWNTFDNAREQCIVLIPEIDQGAPWQIPVPVRFDPFVLGVTLPAILAVERGQHETDMVVRRRIDQVTQFFLA